MTSHEISICFLHIFYCDVPQYFRGKNNEIIKLKRTNVLKWPLSFIAFVGGLNNVADAL